MKKVFSKTVEVVAIWASQSQAEARTGGNTWCRGAVLGSYGTPIGRIYYPPRSPGVALISHARYSGTTATVIGQAIDEAGKAGLSIFEVARIGLDAEGAHEKNVALFKRLIGEEIDKISKAVRPDTAARYRRSAAGLIAKANLYARTFRVRWSYKGTDPESAPGRDREA